MSMAECECITTKYCSLCPISHVALAYDRAAQLPILQVRGRGGGRGGGRGRGRGGGKGRGRGGGMWLLGVCSC